MLFSSNQSRKLRKLLVGVAQLKDGDLSHLPALSAEAAAFLADPPFAATPRGPSHEAKEEQRQAFQARQRAQEKAIQEHADRVRERVMSRARGRCEACALHPLRGQKLQLDHWLGGGGRRNQQQTVENCWALCPSCHRKRTDNSPSARYWNDTKRIHSQMYGYPFTPHIEHEELPR